MSYTVVNTTPMTGGTSIPIGDHTLSPSNFKYKEELPWYTGTSYSISSEVEGAATNFYYKINSRSGSSSFIVSAGVYVDIPIELPWQVVSGMDYVPQYMWYVLSNSSQVSIEDTNSSQSYGTSFSSSGATEVGIPGTLLSYEVSELPYDDYYSDWGTRYGCTATYRFWLCSNFDFLLDAAAKLSVTQKIGSGSYYTENVYLHFDNVPYITCPSEIIDEDYGFNVEYSFPSLSKIEYIQFALCDESDNPIIDYRDIPRTSNNYTFSLTDEVEMDKLYTKYNTVNEATIYLSVRYKSTSDASPTYLAFPMNFVIVTVNPTMTVSLSDPKGLADSGVFIEGLSDLRVVVDPIAYKGATITYIAIGNGSQAYMGQKDVTFETVTYDQVEVLCKDSRGNSVSQWFVLDKWVPYIAPNCSITAEAPNTDGYLPITVSGIYFDSYKTYFTNGFNIYYKYISSNSENSLESWTLLSPQPTITVDSSYRYTTTFEILVPNHSDTYTVQIQFSDSYNTYTSNSATVKAIPVFDWGQEDFNFNVPVTIQGDLTVTGSINGAAATADYVVEIGSSGIWTYRKWNSGIAECWGSLGSQTISISTAWGAIYIKDDALLRQNYPFTFTETPVVTMNLYNTSGNCWAYTGTQGSTSMSPGFGLARGTSGTVTVNAKYLVVGRWK